MHLKYALPIRKEQSSFLTLPEPKLSFREAEVLSLIRDGSSNEEIAEKLNIVVGTVKAHVRKILNKFQTDDRLGASIISQKLLAAGEKEDEVFSNVTGTEIFQDQLYFLDTLSPREAQIAELVFDPFYYAKFAGSGLQTISSTWKIGNEELTLPYQESNPERCFLQYPTNLDISHNLQLVDSIMHGCKQSAITEGTVKSHIRAILNKLAITDGRSEAVSQYFNAWQSWKGLESTRQNYVLQSHLIELEPNSLFVEETENLITN